MKRSHLKGVTGCIAILCLTGSTACDLGTPTVKIDINDYRFTPNEIHLPAFKPVHVVVTNQGRERHTFQSTLFTTSRVTVTVNEEARVNYREEGIILHPGQSIALVIVAPPGMYGYRCPIRGHGGMEGSLFVDEGDQKQSKRSASA